MRTPDERVEELHRRMDALKQAKARRKFLAVCASASAACLIIAVLLALVVSQIPVHNTDAVASSVTASIFFTDHASLGYVLVAIVALCLGVLVTVFCFRMKKHMDDSREKRDD